MAESKFLKYQDQNRDNLIDVCEVPVEPTEEPICKDCVPNPKALVPNWKTSESLTPFFNEKLCKYQIPITTPETTTGGENSTTEQEAEDALNKFFETYSNEVYEAFLDFYDKGVTDANKAILQENVEFRDYYLEARPFSHLQLLYSFPFLVLSLLEGEEEAEQEEEQTDPGETVVEYLASDMAIDLVRIRKSLNLYSRYEKVYKFTDGGTLVFVDTGGLFNLENYGDVGLLAGSSITSNLLPQLDQFLNNKGFNLPGVGGISGLLEDKVTKIEFTFSGEYKLIKMKVYSEGCGDVPKEFKKKKLASLNKKSAWKDPTAVAYFAQLKQMEVALTARVPQPWLEFIKQYTYPQVETITNAGYTNTDPENSSSSCIASNLAAEGKQLGQDIMDPIFGLGDAIASQFHKALCNEDYKEMLAQKIELGQIPKGVQNVAAQGRDVELIDAVQFISKNGEQDASKNIEAFALEQAFKELDESDQVFINFCALTTSGFSRNGDVIGQMDALWANGFDKIRVCGLFDLMLDAIQCLFKGLTLEEALTSMTSAALSSMSIENFGDLFIGLPIEKQQEIDALVRKKIENGDIFPAGSQEQRVSDEASVGENARIDVDDDVQLFVKPTFKIPWENPELVNKQNQEDLREGSYESTSPTGIPPASSRESDVADATSKAQLKNIGSELSPALVMQVYTSAIIEVYADNLLDLVDILNRFPGAQIISKVIALIDCPVPPIFDPSLVDFLKDIELPFCRNTNHIGLPRVENPFGYLPKITDIFRFIFQLIRIQIQKLVMNIIMKLITKICELIGNSICKALETANNIATGLPPIAGGRDTLRDVIKDTICGPNADEEQIDNTIVDMFQKLGSGGAAFADKQAVMSFAEDMSSATTRRELSNAVIGEPSDTFLSVVEGLIEYEYPQFEGAFNNKDNISSFFKNIGNLMPADAKQAVKDFARGLGQEDELPANPSLCATPQQIEDFCSVRSGLLSGRASPEQIKQLCDSARDSFKDDIEDLSGILNDGIANYIENNMPPMVSDPGCNNGLAPFEPEEISKATTNSIAGNLDSLKIAYTYDMIGNGPGQGNWGFMNMVLSDTMGNPYTTHVRKSFNSGGRLIKKRYVDFYVEGGSEQVDEDTNYASVEKQQGAFPNNVADWLIEEMPRRFVAGSFDSKNNPVGDEIRTKTFRELNFDGLFGDVDLLSLPDTGYNTDITVDFEEKLVNFNRKARKKGHDLEIQFRDNAKGTADGDSPFSYGFDLRLFLSDIVEEDGEFKNRPDDNARIIITSVVNTAAEVDASDGAYSNSGKRAKNSGDEVVRWRAYEFLSTDNGLSGLDLTTYGRFSETENMAKTYIPQVYMLQDIIEKAGTTPPSAGDIKSIHDGVMDSLKNNFARQVYTNEQAFKYGAEFDDLDYDDIQYGVRNDDGEFVEYAVYAAQNGITNEDAVFGLSRDQFNRGDDARVIYLDPSQFGGNYFNPPLYIKPQKNTGWLGFVDVMFPELGPCKPYRADVIDFDSIQKRISDSYSRIPEDERLKTNPDCVNEEPYNRILQRPSKAGIEGLMSAAIRIYASVHLLKAVATFTKFRPDFRNTFSTLYPQYIIERMEHDFKDAQPNDSFESVDPFKDTDFWYAFLEQAVQTYARRYADGQLEDPPLHVIQALERIEESINSHARIDKKTYETPDGRTIIGLRDAKRMGDAGLLQTLKSYRSDKNLEIIRETEEDAKLVFQEMVIEELQYIADVYIKNMQDTGLAGDDIVNDIRKYVLEELTVGSKLDIDKEIKEEVEGVPTEDLEAQDNLYTSGGVFITEGGEDYIGYYHIHIDDEGDPIYMEGAYHIEEAHQVLKVSADKIIVPIGDVSWLNPLAVTTDDKPFKIEKYIKVGSTLYSSNEEAKQALLDAAAAESLIPSETNISDLFPGTMELVYDADGIEIGVQGELGVRYGLQFFVDEYKLVSVEVDALDLTVDQFQPLEGNTKLLLCLVENLLDDMDFNAVVKYVFPLNKILSTIAIYNDLAFVPSIGELVVEDGFETDDVADKPGRFISVEYGENDSDGAPVTTINAANGANGWFTAEERSSGLFVGNGLILLHYDKWDQNILTKSRTRIKKLFKGFYNSRDFDPTETDADNPAEALKSQLTAGFKPASGQRLLPWWKKRMLRTNPFNANGQLCDKKD
jgi:hypothetical protein